MKWADTFTQHCCHCHFLKMTEDLWDCVVVQHWQFVKKGLCRFNIPTKQQRPISIAKVRSTQSRVILSHLTTLSNGHTIHKQVTWCGVHLTICASANQRSRKPFSLMLCLGSCFWTHPFSSLLPGPFPCLWDSRAVSRPVRHQWAIASEEKGTDKNGNLNGHIVELLYWSLSGCLSYSQLSCCPTHPLISLALFQAPQQLWSLAFSCQSSLEQSPACPSVMDFLPCPKFFHRCSPTPNSKAFSHPSVFLPLLQQLE